MRTPAARAAPAAATSSSRLRAPSPPTVTLMVSNPRATNFSTLLMTAATDPLCLTTSSASSGRETMSGDAARRRGPRRRPALMSLRTISSARSSALAALKALVNPASRSFRALRFCGVAERWRRIV
eukprot:6994765-Prymnesium_polylepis.1